MHTHILYVPEEDRSLVWHNFDLAYQKELGYSCCADMWCGADYDYDKTMVGICKECGCPVDSDGKALRGCDYSPWSCGACGFYHCDGSC